MVSFISRMCASSQDLKGQLECCKGEVVESGRVVMTMSR
jgi:hypothetical protein